MKPLHSIFIVLSSTVDLSIFDFNSVINESLRKWRLIDSEGWRLNDVRQCSKNSNFFMSCLFFCSPLRTLENCRKNVEMETNERSDKKTWNLCNFTGDDCRRRLRKWKMADEIKWTILIKVSILMALSFCDDFTYMPVTMNANNLCLMDLLLDVMKNHKNLWKITLRLDDWVKIIRWDIKMPKNVEFT